MSIEIRAWDTKTKRMTICRSINEWLNTYAQFEYDTQNCQTNRINNFIFLRYTGLKDDTIKKQKIFEGDKVKALNRNYDNKDNREEYFQGFEVTFLNGCFMFGNWNAHEFFNKFIYKEVVGHVFEDK